MRTDIGPALPEELVTTPEGAALRFRTASATERMTAFGLDVALLAVVLFVAAIVFGPLLGPAPILLLLFFARQFYFTWFETRWNGTTFGKRRLNLRVIRADGGPLTTEILLARNFTREVELFLPLQLILMPEQYHGGHSGVLAVVSTLWVVGLLFFPLTNRHRLRVGDLLAGTRVVVSPKIAMLTDLADHGAGRSNRPSEAPVDRPVFTPRQLEIYGIKELEVLEDVLRKARTHGGRATTAAVMQSITRRIEWQDDGRRWPPEEFLRAFYRAQRKHLEDKLLLGQRRDRKVESGHRPTAPGRHRDRRGRRAEPPPLPGGDEDPSPGRPAD